MEPNDPAAPLAGPEAAEELTKMPDSWAGLSRRQRAFAVAMSVAGLIYVGIVGPEEFGGRHLADSPTAHLFFAIFGAVAGFVLSIFAINASYALFPIFDLLLSVVKWFLRALPTLIIIGLVGGAIWGIGAWLFSLPSWAAVIIVLLVLVVLK